MHHHSWRRIAGAFLGGLMAFAPSAISQSNGSAGAGWAATANAQGTMELKLDPKQTEIVQRVSGYFNVLKQMKGNFAQTDPDKKKSRGRFYVQKPGKFRFDYGAPSRKIMASDGRMLRIKEPDQSNPDAVELDNTPFRLLLKKDVDLLRDARILDVQEAEDVLIVALQDRSPDAPGRVQLVFVKAPEIELKEWVVRDPQGLETRVELTDINRKDPVDSKLFDWDQDFFKQ
jgi:outer membrane lipoprotein-sorting protein